MRSVWRPAELLRDLAQATPPVTGHTAAELVADLVAATSRVIGERCLAVGRLAEAGTAATLEEPAAGVPCRVSDGRPVTSHALDELYTTPVVVAQERYIDLVAGTGVWGRSDVDATRVENRRVRDHTPPGVVLDAGQVRAAAAVAGRAPMVLVEGPAGTGKTTMLAAAVTA